ncbi:MAG: hypothetical protein ACP5I3_11610 [Thermoproteus sp.]
MRNGKIKGISDLVVAIIMAVIGVAAVLLFWMFTQGKFLTPFGAPSFQLDYSATTLSGKLGYVAIMVQSGSAGIQPISIVINDPSTGTQISSCTITSNSGNAQNIYTSGMEITASCPPNGQYVSGYTYTVVLTYKNMATGQTSQVSFNVQAH